MRSFKLTEYLLGGGNGAKGPTGTSPGLQRQGGLGRCLGEKERARGSSKSMPGTVGTHYETDILLQVRQHESPWPRTQRQAGARLTPQAGLSPAGSIASPRMVVEGTSGRRGWGSTVRCRDWLQGILVAGDTGCRPAQLPSWLSIPLKSHRLRQSGCSVPEAQEDLWPTLHTGFSLEDDGGY